MPWTRPRSPSSRRTRGRRATHAGPPLDRISVRDYIRQVEIGAFRTERGVTQRIRFNVVLEVSHHTAAQDDDVDKVISYDTITEAIEARARRRADQPARDPGRAGRRALPCRSRAPCGSSSGSRSSTASPARSASRSSAAARRRGAPRLRPVRCRAAEAGAAGRAWSTSPPRRRRPEAARWRDALAAWGHPLVLCLGAADAAARRREPRRSAASGFWPSSRPPGRSATRDPRFGVAATAHRARLGAEDRPALGLGAVAHGGRGAAGRRPTPATRSALAAWLRGDLGAEMLVVAGAARRRRRGLRLRAAARPRISQDLA